MHISPQTPIRVIIKHAFFLLMEAEKNGMSGSQTSADDNVQSDGSRGSDILNSLECGRDPLEKLWEDLAEVFIPLAQQPESVIFELKIPKNIKESSLKNIASQLTKDQAGRFLEEIKGMPHTYKKAFDTLFSSREGADREKVEVSFIVRMIFKGLGKFMDKEKVIDSMVDNSNLRWHDNGLAEHSLRIRLHQ